MEEKVEYITSEISELIKALCKAKKEFKPISKDGKNPFLNSKYVTLDGIINATKDALANNGLVIIHHEKIVENKKILVTELIHESGQIKPTETCMDDFLTVQLNEKGNAKVTPIQVFGLVKTYLKRYHTSDLLDISVDEDNDGNDPDKNKNLNPLDTGGLDTISEPEIAQLLEYCKKAGLETETQALNKVKSILKSNHKALSELTMPEFATMIKSLESSKIQASNGNADTDKNRKRAFAIANKLLMVDDQIKADIIKNYNLESRKDMTEEQWQSYCHYLIQYEALPVNETQIEEMKALPKPYADATLPKFLEFVNSNLIVAKENTKDAKGNRIVHTPITKLKHMQIWEADYIIRILKVKEQS